MITLKEFCESEVNDMIDELNDFYGIQMNGTRKYLNMPFPTKEEIMDSFDDGLDSPYDEIEETSSDEEKQIISEARECVAAEYDRIKEIRDKFSLKYIKSI